MPTRFSFIVPFHRDFASLSRCLSAVTPLPPESELIVAADAAKEDCRRLALEHGASIVIVDGPSGPAVARNAAAAAAVGDVFVFIDADVVVSRASLQNLVAHFQNDSPTDAVFGSYDDAPDDPGFISQYKNLSHAYVHRASERTAQTFWAGFGAVRREAFEAVGGFDERFERPSVEDIDLGYRLNGAGYAVAVDPTLSACHLKRWTLRGALVSDIRDRGIPWTQLLLRYGIRGDHLNVSLLHRWSVVFAYLTLASLALMPWDPRFAAGLAVWLPAITLLNGRYYHFLCRSRGVWFAARAWPLQLLHHWCNGASFVVGTGLYLARRHLRLESRHALSSDSWTTLRASCCPICTGRLAQRVSRRGPFLATSAVVPRAETAKSVDHGRW